eukprot:m.351786 g.351786  ORF g.351786 m.351786 type:complete len:57 (+) comp16349_c0_seq1:2074-2244(+)
MNRCAGYNALQSAEQNERNVMGMYRECVVGQAKINTIHNKTLLQFRIQLFVDASST